MKGFGILIKWFELDVGWKLSRQRGLSEGEKIWSRERDFCRERRREVNFESCPPLNIKHNSMDWRFYQGSVEHWISTKMNLSRWCWGSIDDKTHLDGSNKLSRIYRADREQRNLGQWIKEAIENVLSKNPEILMDQESVEMLSRR